MSTLFARFLRHPGQVGACCASSRYLGRAITAGIGIEQADVVAELGPGTGVFTGEILRRLPDRGKLLAVELDRTLAEDLERRYPEVLLCRGCASKLGEFLRARALPPPRAVVSGLPWAIFPEELQEKILTGVVNNLPNGGYFATFAYVQGLMLPAGQRFRRRLRELFHEVDTGEIVLRNFPPAFVYRCRK